MSRLRNIGNFESEWQHAFQGASVTPPARVWDRVEVALDENGGTAAKKFLTIPLLIAASIAFALGVTSAGYYYVNSESNFESGTLSSNAPSIFNSNSDDNAVPDIQLAVPNANEDMVITDDNPQVPEARSVVKAEPAGKVVLMDNSVRNDAGIVNSGQVREFLASSSENRIARLEPLYEGIPVQFSDTEVRPVAALLGMTRRQRQTWTGLAMGAGSYNPNSSGEVFGGFGLASADYAESNAQSFDQERTSSGEGTGSSYSIGVGAGFDLSAKWLIQGGMSYLRYSNTAYSNAIDPATGRLLLRNPAGADVARFSTLLDVTNETEYLSIPLQVGYYLINRKFVWSLSGGVATDIFLRNQVDGTNGVYSDTQKIGHDSDYRSAYFNLLIGTEVGYTFDERYRFTVFPSFRHSITPMYKTDSGATGLPFSGNMGFRFTYIFR